MGLHGGIWGSIGSILGEYIGIAEKKMETTIMGCMRVA